MKKERATSHFLVDFANQTIEAQENPSRDDLRKDIVFKQEVYRVLSAAARALKDFQPEKDMNGEKKFDRFKTFDPIFFKNLNRLKRHMRPHLSPYGVVIKDGKHKMDPRPRLEWQMVWDWEEASPVRIEWFYLEIAKVLSDPDFVEALKQCPECGRLFLSTHSQKEYCRRQCATTKALHDYYRRKEKRENRRYWDPRKKKKRKEVPTRTLAVKTRIGDLRKAKGKLEGERG